MQEEKELKECIQRWKLPVGKLVADGQCIPNLFASMVKWRNSIVQLHLPSAKNSRHLPRAAVQNFNRGDIVRLQTHPKSGADSGNHQGGSHESVVPEDDQLEICGTVCDISLTKVRVEVDEVFIRGLQEIIQQAKAKNLMWRIDFGFSPITYTRMKGALEMLAEEHSHSSQALDFIVSSHETTELHRETVLMQPQEFPVGFSSLPSDLNASQLQACSTAIQSRISLIQGME